MMQYRHTPDSIQAGISERQPGAIGEEPLDMHTISIGSRYGFMDISS